MNPAIRVLVADDQRVVREGLATLLGLLAGVEVVGTAADGDEALALAIRLRPDVVLMDLRMPHCEQPEQGGESLADHALVIGHQDADGRVQAGTHSSTRNPPPVGPAVSVPPSSSARSLMPVSP